MVSVSVVLGWGEGREWWNWAKKQRARGRIGTGRGAEMAAESATESYAPTGVTESYMPLLGPAPAQELAKIQDDPLELLRLGTR